MSHVQNDELSNEFDQVMRKSSKKQKQLEKLNRLREKENSHTKSNGYSALEEENDLDQLCGGSPLFKEIN